MFEHILVYEYFNSNILFFKHILLGYWVFSIEKNYFCFITVNSDFINNAY